ncbi:MAG: ribose-phosphate diphosphokinase [Polyangiaceae bacterium]|nr:ribose-phosphate diphosphokinase [Polyangiaceae bacterium]
MNPTPIVFFAGDYEYLHREICALGHLEPGEIEVRNFPDGERYQRICTDVANRDVVLVGGTINDDSTLTLFDLASELVKSGAYRLSLVIPYFGYSTMERAQKPGEVVTAKSRARLLSAIPRASRGNRVFLLDLHTEGITHYFEGAITTRHLSAGKLVAQSARELGGSNFVLACTDAGRAKLVESLANDLGVHAAFVFKRRLDGSRTEVLAVSAQVHGKIVVIYDDMIRTGGSLVNAARAYKEAGAVDIYAITTHGLFPGDALDRIRRSGLIRSVVCTNSHPNATAVSEGCGDFLRVVSVAGVFWGDLLG